MKNKDLKSTTVPQVYIPELQSCLTKNNGGQIMLSAMCMIWPAFVQKLRLIATQIYLKINLEEEGRQEGISNCVYPSLVFSPNWSDSAFVELLALQRCFPLLILT